MITPTMFNGMGAAYERSRSMDFSSKTSFTKEKEFISYVASVVNEICKFQPFSLAPLNNCEEKEVSEKLHGRHNGKEFKLAVSVSSQHPIIHLDYYQKFDLAVGNSQGDKLVRKRLFTMVEDQAHTELEKEFSPLYDIHDSVRCFKLLSKSDYFNMLKVIHAGQYIVYRTILKNFKFRCDAKFTNITIPGVAKILNIEDISECFGISKYHFHRMFKSFTNVTIKEYETTCEIFIKNYSEQFQEIIIQHEIFFEHGPSLITMNDLEFWSSVPTMVNVSRPLQTNNTSELFLDGFFVDFNTNANNRASKKRKTADMVKAGVYSGNGRDATIYDQQVVTRDFRRGFFGEQAKKYVCYDIDRCLSFSFTDLEKIPNFVFREEVNKIIKPRRFSPSSPKKHTSLPLLPSPAQTIEKQDTSYFLPPPPPAPPSTSTSIVYPQNQQNSFEIFAQNTGPDKSYEELKHFTFKDNSQECIGEPDFEFIQEDLFAQEDDLSFNHQDVLALKQIENYTNDGSKDNNKDNCEYYDDNGDGNAQLPSDTQVGDMIFSNNNSKLISEFDFSLDNHAMDAILCAFENDSLGDKNYLNRYALVMDHVTSNETPESIQNRTKNEELQNAHSQAVFAEQEPLLPRTLGNESETVLEDETADGEQDTQIGMVFPDVDTDEALVFPDEEENDFFNSIVTPQVCSN